MCVCVKKLVSVDPLAKTETLYPLDPGEALRVSTGARGYFWLRAGSGWWGGGCGRDLCLRCGKLGWVVDWLTGEVSTP